MTGPRLTTLLVAMAAAALGGCGTPPGPAPAKAPATSVRVEWLGHNCFLVTSAFGISVMLDPYDTKYLDYPVSKNLRPDVILVSSEQPQVSNDELASNSPPVFRDRAAIGPFTSRGVAFRGVSTSEPETAGTEVNVAFVWQMDGITFCHLGLPSGPLTARVAAKIGRVDVLFLPVGNPFLLTDEARLQMVVQLAPRVVVPMSYSNARTTRLGYGAPDTWLAAQGHPIRRLDRSTFTITRKSLPAATTVFLPSVP